MRKPKDLPSTITEPVTSFTALSIEPVGNRLFCLVTLAIEDDEVIAIDRSEPKPFHLALAGMKAQAASIWPGI